MITLTGKSVYPGDGSAPSLYDVGWGLARTARFAGQTKVWYSVLPHVFAVADIVSPDAKLHALLHDAAEAVLGDQVATWKNEVTKADEREILRVLYADLGLDWDLIPKDVADEVHAADIACRSAEALLLGHSTPNASFFEAVRFAQPTLFQAALDSTKTYMVNYEGTLCINDTEFVADRFVSEVSRWLSHAKRVQEVSR